MKYAVSSMSMKKKQGVGYFFLSFLLLFLPQFVTAQNYTLMAPMGSTLSGSPDLTTYLQGAVTVIIGIAGLLAMIRIVYCGIRLMMSQSASGKSEAKECIWTSILGLLLAIGAWILLYTINPLLLSNELNLTEVALAPPSGGTVSTPAPTAIYRWSTRCETIPGFSCTATLPSNCSGAQPTGSNCYAYTVRTSLYTPATGGGDETTDTGTTAGTTTPPPETIATFSAANYTVNEGASSITMTVTRSSGTGTGSIDYYTSSSGATPDEDYRNVFGTLIFAEGVTTRTFGIPIMNDTLSEGGENITVTLSGGTGAVGLGTVASTVVQIIDNEPPVMLDTVFPALTITSPASNLATSSRTINVTFTASDNQLIKRLEYVYAPPSPALASTHIICNTDCDPSPVTMTVPVAIDVGIPGTHIITVNVCDSRQCFSRGVSVIVEAPCVASTIVNCKTLPTGDTTAPQCTTAEGTAGISVLGENVWSAPWCLPDTYDPDHDPVLHPELADIYTTGTTTGQCFPGAWVNSPKVDAYAFKITSDNGGGNIYIADGDQNEWPPPQFIGQGSCSNQGSCNFNDYVAGTAPSGCYCYFDEVTTNCYFIDGIPNILPNNLIVSVSNVPGDMTSTAATVYTQAKRLSGYCGTANAPFIDRFATFISVNSSGPGICRVERDRTYYFNVTVIPFLANGNTLYSLFWDFLGAPACTPLSPETQTLSCPTGQIGSITQTRTSSCPGPAWSAWTTTANTCRAIPDATPPASDFLIQDVCLNENGDVIALDPLSPLCTLKRNLQFGELLPYHKHDLHGIDLNPAAANGYQRSDSFPTSVDSTTAAQTLDFGVGGATFGQKDPQDGHNTYEAEGQYVSITGTKDPVSGTIYFISPPCVNADAWTLFPTNSFTGGSGTFSIKSSFSPSSCPSTFNSTYTAWDFPSSPLTYTSGATLISAISYHYSHATVALSDHLEKLYFTKEYGGTRWERWERSGTPYYSATDEASRPSRAQALTDSGRCNGPGFVTDGLGPYGPWYRVDCREWTNIILDTGSPTNWYNPASWNF